MEGESRAALGMVASAKKLRQQEEKKDGARMDGQIWGVSLDAAVASYRPNKMGDDQTLED